MPNIQFQFRRGTASEWTSANPTLAAGEMGIETNTSLFKIGNGATGWSGLSYGGLQGATGPTGAGTTGPTGPASTVTGPTGAAGAGALPNLTINEVTGTSQTLASSNWNQYFYITNSGFNAVTLPATTATSNAGYFWTLRNATQSYLSITLTNTLSLTSPLVIPPANATTLAISGVSSNTILLL